MGEIEEFYSYLKLQSLSKKNERVANFDDFCTAAKKTFSKKSIRWLTLCYRDFVENFSESSPLSLTIMNTIPFILDDSTSTKSYISTAKLDSENSEFAKRKQNRQASIKKTQNAKNYNQKKNDTYYQEQIFNEQYDCVSSLSLLEESYYMIKPMVINSEKTNDILMVTHKEFKEDLNKLPKNIVKAQKYENFIPFEKEFLVNLLENNWKRFRLLLLLTFEINKSF